MAKKKASKKAASKKKSKASSKKKTSQSNTSEGIVDIPGLGTELEKAQAHIMNALNYLDVVLEEGDREPEKDDAEEITMAMVKKASVLHKKEHGDEDLKNIYIEIGKAENTDTTTGRMLASVPKKNYAKVMEAFENGGPDDGNGGEDEVSVSALKEALKELPKKKRKKFLKESRVDKDELDDLEPGTRFSLMEKLRKMA